MVRMLKLYMYILLYYIMAVHISELNLRAARTTRGSEHQSIILKYDYLYTAPLYIYIYFLQYGMCYIVFHHPTSEPTSISASSLLIILLLHKYRGKIGS